MSAYLRSASSALEMLRPMQGHSAPPATSTTHQLAAQPRKVRLSFRKRSTDVEKAAQHVWRFATTVCSTVSNCYVSDHLYLSRPSAGRGVRSWRWMISRHGACSPARRAPCRRSRGRNSQVARQDRLTQQKVRFRCVSRYIRPWCAVVFTGGMRERHRTSPAGFESSRVASCGPLAGVAGGRRWRTSLAGVAGGLAGEAHKKTDQFH